MMSRKYWACSDGNGGYDIGLGDITIASVIAPRDLPRKGRGIGLPDDYDTRAEAMRFKASADMLAALRAAAELFDSESITGGTVDIVAAAIARAEGRI